MTLTGGPCSFFYSHFLMVASLIVTSSLSPLPQPISVGPRLTTNQGTPIDYHGNESMLLYPIYQMTNRNSQKDEDGIASMAAQERLIQALVEMQKKAEALENLPHTAAEEESVTEFFEGDIVLTFEQASEILHDLSPRRKRKLAEPLAKRWEMPIPYMFDGTHNAAERGRIYEALSYWEGLTCVRFQENPSATNKLLFTKGNGCWSYVGYTHQNNQTVSIGDGCQSNGTIAHEVGHAIGFWHEQSRPDRDEFILIHQTNVSLGKLYNFEPRTWGEIITLDVPYDLGSDMHYGAKFYAKDTNSTTVETRDFLMARVIGQRQELSFYDVKLANKAYCDDVCSHVELTQPCRRDGYQDPTDCSRCRCPDGFSGDYCQTVAPSVNAYCSGVLDARYNGTIYSPGYPRPGYQPDTQCHWLIKAPEGSRVYLQFVDEFGIAGHVDVCRDYVEVRYNTSLSLTGPRFCIDDPPRYALRSSSNEMLVLFHSYTESRSCEDANNEWKCKFMDVGFKARYYTGSCGGCHHQDSVSQPPCIRQVKYTCTQTWQEKIKIDCPKWWYTDSCGMRTINRVRYARCSRDESYCCGQYDLQDDMCIARYATPVPYQPPGVAAPSRPAPTWSDWSSWGVCPRKCGGAVRARTRKCLTRNLCSGSYVEAEKSPCAQTPCYRTCLVHKRVLCDMWSTCTRSVHERCKPYCYPGFALHTGPVCLSDNSYTSRSP